MTSTFPCPPLNWQAVERARAHARMGRHVVYEPSAASTSLLARSLLRRGAADGTVVVADEQTRGRGRLGRRWVSPPGGGLTFSLCLWPRSGFLLNTLGPAAALAVGDVVRALVGARCTLKWPNDVLVDGAKVCGILLDLDEVDGSWAAVVGIGLNVNAAPPLATATCLAAVAGAALAREPLLTQLLAALESYVDLAGVKPDSVMQQWRDRLDSRGRRVRVHGVAGVLEGLAVDIDAEGALLVRLDDGTTCPVRAGDVTVAAVTT